MSDENQHEEGHETRGTFLITGMLLFGFAAVWILIYLDLLGR
jgi:hypothetical protein